MNNADQAEFWAAQTSWIHHQAAMDKLLDPVLDLVLTQAQLQPGEHVLDIGCGTGASVLAAANAVGAAGHVRGVDISPALLQSARDRAAGRTEISLLCADAQSEPLGTGYDALISRFGVMFFEDTPAAFARLAQALKPGARLVMAAWGPAHENPYFMQAAVASREVLGEMPKVDRTLPGPFAFEDAARVQKDLAAAGLQDISVTPHRLDLTPAGGLPEFAELSLAIGAAASAVRHFDATPSQIATLRTAILARFAEFEKPEGLRIPALINLITARTEPA